MRAIDVMTPTVIVASPEMSVRAAASLLLENHISGMPVIDSDGKVIGIVSEGDLLHRTENETCVPRRSWWLESLASSRELAREYVKENAQTVGELMSDEVVSVQEDTPLADIAALLERRRIKRVPVLRDGQLVGIVSRSNLLRALASTPVEAMPSTPHDRELHRAIVNELSGHRWNLPAENVVVRDGIAHVWGIMRTEEEMRAICVAARSVPGIKDVISHLEYPAAVPLM